MRSDKVKVKKYKGIDGNYLRIEEGCQGVTIARNGQMINIYAKLNNREGFCDEVMTVAEFLEALGITLPAED